MQLPNRDRVIIEQSKLVGYLLNPDHERGGSKAKLLLQFGYSSENWQQLDADLRKAHLFAEVEMTKQTPYGIRYIVAATLQTPVSRELPIKTVWQIDLSTDSPRLITLVPD